MVYLMIDKRYRVVFMIVKLSIIMTTIGIFNNLVTLINQNFGHHLDDEYDLGSHINKVFANIRKTTRGSITPILIVV